MHLNARGEINRAYVEYRSQLNMISALEHRDLFNKGVSCRALVYLVLCNDNIEHILTRLSC